MGDLLDQNTLGVVLESAGTLLAMVALIYSMTTFRKSLNTSHYTEIDKSYFEILKTAMQYPFVQSPSELTLDQKAKYELYALMMWNFLEAIYDRCLRSKELKRRGCR